MKPDYLIILLEIIVVLLISRIKVPGLWADKFFTALVGSIPAIAIVGLLAWLLIFKVVGNALIFLMTFQDPDVVTDLVADHSAHPIGAAMVLAIQFIDAHPITALAFGPLLTIYGLFTGAFTPRNR